MQVERDLLSGLVYGIELVGWIDGSIEGGGRMKIRRR